MSEQAELQDMTIECVDCKEDFVFTTGEQEFFKDKIGPNYNVPKRCKPCRQAKKQRSG